MVRRKPVYERMGNGRWRSLNRDGVREASAHGAGQREAYRVRHAKEIAPQLAEQKYWLKRLAYDTPDYENHWRIASSLDGRAVEAATLPEEHTEILGDLV